MRSLAAQPQRQRTLRNSSRLRQGENVRLSRGGHYQCPKRRLEASVFAAFLAHEEIVAEITKYVNRDIDSYAERDIIHLSDANNNFHTGAETMTRFKVLGINDDRDTCDCCGKTGLKRVVWIEDTETLQVSCFGTSCAANPAKAFGLKKEIAKAVREYDKQQAAARQERRNAALTEACRKAASTYPGEYRQGRFGRIPVDAAAYEAHKRPIVDAVKAAFA